MKKRVLVTAGQVYGPLDDNKLVGNRVRGIWASRFADFLADRGDDVTLLVPDVNTPWPPGPPHDNLRVVIHKGYWDYAEKCEKLAPKHDAAVMAAAVVNWIPAEPVKGKMATAGYKEGDTLNIPFVLAPRVINRMRVVNPNLTLIGCKMLIGSTPDELVDAAYHVIHTSKANVVVANDMKAGLRTKRLVFPDRTVIDYEDNFDGFFRALCDVIDDEHWHSVEVPAWNRTLHEEYWARESLHIFDRIVERYRAQFTPRGTSGQVFGSLLVPTQNGGYFASPREKEALFSSKDAVWVAKLDLRAREVRVGRGARATMNAPLMVRFAQHIQKQAQEGSCYAVQPPVLLHLHEQLEGVPTLPYGPPGTDRDNLRLLPDGVPAFNIEGHGFIACVSPATGEILR